MENTQIEWATHTFNPWLGCQAVSPGCANCYAETWAKRYGKVQWGPGMPRKLTSDANWQQPLAWNRKAAEAGERHRVFCASLADVFDNAVDKYVDDDGVPSEWRACLFTLIAQTPHLDWLLLTKRPENIEDRLPGSWDDGWPNVWLGISAEDQDRYDHRWPILADIPAVVRFVSYEPALGPLSMMNCDTFPDWMIWGGESGPGARPMAPAWASEITVECLQMGIPVFGKQWGRYENHPLLIDRGVSIADVKEIDPPSNGKGGAELGGRLWRQFPEPPVEWSKYGCLVARGRADNDGL